MTDRTLRDAILNAPPKRRYVVSTVLQLLLIFILLRLFMISMGFTFVGIPLLDTLLQKLLNYGTALLEKYQEGKF